MDSTNQRSLRTRLLKALDDDFGKLRPRQHLALALARMFPQLTFARLRLAVLRAGGLRIGRSSMVLGDLIISGGGRWTQLLSIGEGTVITGPLRINLGESVRIGDRVRLGHEVLLVTVGHEIGGPELRCGPQANASIAIGDGAWLASRVTILPGVTVGAGAVVAAGAVVSRDVEPHTLVGGVPAKLIRRLDVPAEPADGESA